MFERLKRLVSAGSAAEGSSPSTGRPAAPPPLISWQQYEADKLIRHCWECWWWRNGNCYATPEVRRREERDPSCKLGESVRARGWLLQHMRGEGELRQTIPGVQSRGLLARPAAEIMEFLEFEIEKWKARLLKDEHPYRSKETVREVLRAYRDAYVTMFGQGNLPPVDRGEGGAPE